MAAGIVVKVKDLMSPNLISVESRAPVSDAIKTMADNEIDSVVVTQGGEPVGILTEQDYLKKVYVKQ